MVRHFAQMASDLREHSAQIETRVLSLAAEAVDAKLAEWVLKAPVPSNVSIWLPRKKCPWCYAQLTGVF